MKKLLCLLLALLLLLTVVGCGNTAPTPDDTTIDAIEAGTVTFTADEAVFEKVRENVYDVFRTVLSVAQKQHGGDAAAVRQFFESRLQQIPSAWEASLEKARQHGDEKKALIEEIKLAAVSDIKAALEEQK